MELIGTGIIDWDYFDLLIMGFGFNWSERYWVSVNSNR